jgi:hypothetical protein
MFGRATSVPILQRTRIDLRMGPALRSDEERGPSAEARRGREILRGGTGFDPGIAIGFHRDVDYAAD